jgi:hypothetical protein
MQLLSSLHQVSAVFRQSWVDGQVHKLLADASREQRYLTVAREWYQVERRGRMGCLLVVQPRGQLPVHPGER